MTKKPEHNGVLVVIESYNEEAEKFTVRSLQGPNNHATPNCLRVVPDHAEYFTAQEYEDCFKDAPKYLEYSHVDGIEEPCTINLSTNYQGEYNSDLTIVTSCRVWGVLSSAESPGRVTQLTKNVSIEAQPEAVIEFEDINFASQPDCSVICTGGSVSFRRCRFSGSINGLTVGPGCVVILESCLFESNNGCSILVDGESHVTLLNCRFWGSGVGICARNRGTVIAEYCSISGPSKGIVVVNSATLHLNNCDVYSSEDYGIVVRNGATAVVKNCRITDCGGDAIAIEGRAETSVWIEDTVVMDCVNGVRIDNGKVDVEMTRYRAVNCAAQFYVGYVTKGSVMYSQCLSVNNAYGMVNLSDEAKCFVRKNGVLSTQRLALRLNEYQSMDIGSEFLTKLADNHVERTKPEMLAVMRLYRAVEPTYVLKCLPCGTVEPSTTKFKMCGDCK